MAQFRTDYMKLDSGQVVTRYEVFGLMETLTPSGSLVDAFGRLRTSNPKTVFFSECVGADDGKFDTKLTGGQTVVAGSGLSNMEHTLRHFLDNTSETYVLSVIPTNNNLKVLTKVDWMIVI